METKTAIIYARVSSVGERQNTERQISDLPDMQDTRISQ